MQRMVWMVLFSALCTAGAVKRLVQCTPSIGLITSYLTILKLSEIKEFQRIEMRTRTAWGNSGIRQLCAFLIWFFYQPSLAIGVKWLCLEPSIPIWKVSGAAHNMVKIANSPLISAVLLEVMHLTRRCRIQNVHQEF